MAKRPPRLDRVFFRIGIEYYISGRAAIRNEHPQAAGNLVHHGFEMMISGILLAKSGYSVQQLRKRFGNHDLRGLWAEVKKVMPGPGRPLAWARYDRFITDLHSWERIRFGEFPRDTPKSLVVDFRRGADVGAKARKQGFDHYRFCLEDADELFVALAHRMGWRRPDFIRNTLIGPEAIFVYEWNNRHIVRSDSTRLTSQGARIPESAG